ncbi:unnamed protein product, partial [Ectocarpus sp. 8 AP-2014]
PSCQAVVELDPAVTHKLSLSLSLSLPLFLVESGEVVFLCCCVEPHTPAGECTGIPKLRRLSCGSAVPSQAGTVAPTPIQSSKAMELIVL